MAGTTGAATPQVAARPCLVVNPGSFRMSRGRLSGKVMALAHAHGLEVLVARDLAGFQATFEVLRRRRQQQIFVLAGDGTIHALAQFLAQLQPGEWLPELLLLGGGRANIVPRDCGGWPPLQRLEAALRTLREGRSMVVEQVPLLRIEQEGQVPQHGFFLAGAMVDAGVRLCRQHRSAGSGWLHRSWIADPWCLLKLALQVAAGRSPLPAYPDLQVTTDAGDVLRAPARVLLVSTLQMRDAPYRPFAARGAGPVRVTVVSATARHFWRRLPALLGGRFSPRMNLQQGYLSGRCHSVEVLGLTGYSLDGEAFATDPARPVRFCNGLSLQVLRP